MKLSISFARQGLARAAFAAVVVTALAALGQPGSAAAAAGHAGITGGPEASDRSGVVLVHGKDRRYGKRGYGYRKHYGYKKHRYGFRKHGYGKRLHAYRFLAQHLDLDLASVSKANGSINEDGITIRSYEELLVFNGRHLRPARAVSGDTDSLPWP